MAIDFEAMQDEAASLADVAHAFKLNPRAQA